MISVDHGTLSGQVFRNPFNAVRQVKDYTRSDRHHVNHGMSLRPRLRVRKADPEGCNPQGSFDLALDRAHEVPDSTLLLNVQVVEARYVAPRGNRHMSRSKRGRRRHGYRVIGYGPRILRRIRAEWTRHQFTIARWNRPALHPNHRNWVESDTMRRGTAPHPTKFANPRP